MRTDILQQAQTVQTSMDALAIVLTDEREAKSSSLYPMGGRAGGQVR